MIANLTKMVRVTTLSLNHRRRPFFSPDMRQEMAGSACRGQNDKKKTGKDERALTD